MHRASLCPLCGKPIEVCTADERTGTAPGFSVEYTACRATMAILDKQRGLFADDKKPNPYASAFLFAATTRR